MDRTESEERERRTERMKERQRERKTDLYQTSLDHRD